MKQFFNSLVIFLAFTTAAIAHAGPEDHGSRIQPPAVVPYDPIKAYVRTTYPADLKTVRSAILWLLEGTQWALQEVEGYAPPDANQILAQNIDPMAQLPRTMSRLDAIQILIGANNAIVLDRNHRLISFTASGAKQ